MLARIKNFSKFQHYRDRRPTWLKFYRDILDSSYARLPDRSWRLGMELLHLAAEREDKLVDVEHNALSWRLRRKITADDVSELVSCEFLELLEPASKLLAEPEQVASTEESRVEGEGEKSRVSVASQPRQQGNGFSPGFLRAWAAYPHFRSRSHKGAAWKLWKAAKLDDLADQVEAWAAYTANTDGQRDGGQYVPAFERWLKDRTFDEKPPEVKIGDRSSGKFARTLEALDRFVARGGTDEGR